MTWKPDSPLVWVPRNQGTAVTVQLGAGIKSIPLPLALNVEHANDHGGYVARSVHVDAVAGARVSRGVVEEADRDVNVVHTPISGCGLEHKGFGRVW